MSGQVAVRGALPASTSRRSLSGRVRKVLKRPQFWFGLLVLVPAVVWYAIFQWGPIVQGLFYAFNDYNFADPSKTRFIGFQNFIMVTKHFLFPIATKNTFVYAIEVWAITFPLSLITAVALVSVKKGRAFFQFAIFMPVVVSLVAMALMFKQLLDPDTGLLNAFLRSLHLPEGKWLTDERSAMPTVAAIDSWKILGTYVVLLAAGLLNIPPEIYDAALVDGANSWQTFWKITLPLLQHVMVLVITMLLIFGLQMFISGTLLPRTPGGPGYATTVLTIWLYNEAFGNWRFGFASAISMTLFLIVFILTLIQMRIRPDWEY